MKKDPVDAEERVKLPTLASKCVLAVPLTDNLCWLRGLLLSQLPSDSNSVLVVRMASGRPLRQHSPLYNDKTSFLFFLSFSIVDASGRSSMGCREQGGPLQVGQGSVAGPHLEKRSLFRMSEVAVLSPSCWGPVRWEALFI